MVNELEIPKDLNVAPYIWCEPERSSESDSISSSSLDGLEANTVSSDSSLALSRAMTDSEIDYDRYRRYKNRSLSDPWLHMRTAVEAFPSGYFDSLKSFHDTTSESTEESQHEQYQYNEELKLKMERFFEDECRVFTPDDPGWILLEEALMNSDLKDSEIDSDI